MLRRAQKSVAAGLRSRQRAASSHRCRSHQPCRPLGLCKKAGRHCCRLRLPASGRTAPATAPSLLQREGLTPQLPAAPAPRRRPPPAPATAAPGGGRRTHCPRGTWWARTWRRAPTAAGRRPAAMPRSWGWRWSQVGRKSRQPSTRAREHVCNPSSRRAGSRLVGLMRPRPLQQQHTTQCAPSRGGRGGPTCRTAQCRARAARASARCSSRPPAGSGGEERNRTRWLAWQGALSWRNCPHGLQHSFGSIVRPRNCRRLALTLPASISAISWRMVIMASQKRSSSALDSDSVGSIMSVPASKGVPMHDGVMSRAAQRSPVGWAPARMAGAGRSPHAETGRVECRGPQRCPHVLGAHADQTHRPRARTWWARGSQSP